MSLKDHFIRTVVDELNDLNGTDFEHLCRSFIELLTDHEFEIKGHNLEMKPVGRSVDLLQDGDFGVIGQCGTDQNYFSGKKAINDIESSLKNNPYFHTIYLFSNRLASGSQLPELENAVKAKLESIKRHLPAYKYHIYDAQRIATNIYDNVHKTGKVKQILSYLPKSFQYYLFMPETNTLPLQKPGYKNRREEKEIEEKLQEVDFLQIYGLSGIGKTETAIAVANNLANRFDTVLWLEAGSITSGTLSAVENQRMGESINLENMLRMFRVLVVVDNLNENVERLHNEFLEKSKKGSKCLVTSLQLNVNPSDAFNLKHLSDDVSKEFLTDCNVPPTDEQLTRVLNNVEGYPLLLKLAKKAVENGYMTWDEIVAISNLTEIDDDERNITFAARIVGRYKDRYRDLFNLLLALDSTKLSRLFLRGKNPLEFTALLRYAIIEQADEFNCSIHSIVLSSIKTVVKGDYSEKAFHDYLYEYLSKYAISRDAGLYTFAAAHGAKLLGLFKDPNLPEALRKIILLACLYSFETFADPQPFLDFFEKVELHPSESELDLRLLIEYQELNIRKFKAESKDEKSQQEQILKYVKVLTELQTSSRESEALRYHHIGKLLSNTRMKEEAEKNLLKAVELNPTSFRSHLKLAREYHKQKLPDKVAEHLEKILDRPDISDVPISVRLSAYDILGSNQYATLRQKYIDNRLDAFANDVHASFSEYYSHTYNVLSRLANHLSYNFPDFFSRLCPKLPLPLNIEHDMDMRKNYGKIVLAQYLFGNYPEQYRKKLFRLAEEYLLSAKTDDYVRRDLIKLYLKASLPEKAAPIAEKLDKSNEFNLQSLCKVSCDLGDFDKALKYIEAALSKAFSQKAEYRAAFRHDKALCLHGQADPDARSEMLAAINLQPNPKIKNDWHQELSLWPQ